MDILRDPIWTGLGVIVTIVLGLIAFYLQKKNKAWLILAGAIVILIGGLTLGVQLQIAKDSQSKILCPAYLESNGQVVMNADKYFEQVPGRKYPPDESNPERDATGISWQKNNEFPNTLQALPDSQPTNTMAYTNGPALVYLIDFQTTGKYYVYIRGFGPDGEGDSIHIGLGGIPVTTDFVNGYSLLADKPTPRWVGENVDTGDPAIVDVQNPGLNTLYIWMRENGVNVQRIWLDTGANKVSNGDITEGPAISPCAK